MKKLKMILVWSLVLTSGLTFAQPGGGQRGGQSGPPPLPNEQQIKVMVGELADAISLTEEQEINVLKLYTEHFVQVEELTSGSSRPDRKEMEALKTSLENQVKLELTQDQIKTYEAILKKQASRQRRR